VFSVKRARLCGDITSPVELGRGTVISMAADLVDTLRRTDLLSSVPAGDLEGLIAGSRLRTLRRGQIVCTTGDPGDTLIVIISGQVKVVVRSADGGELTLTFVGPAGVLGEVSVADGGPRSADVETVADSKLLFIPRELVQAVCARVPAAGQALSGAIAATLRRLTEATSDLVFLDMPRRVAKMLLSLPRSGDGIITQPLTQEEYARRVGSTRQSVNIALRGFERRGWIEIHERSVTVRQPDALARFAGG
jgi:CRP/FNR family transcriptional regulator, cyclic AMP receptor protein